MKEKKQISMVLMICFILCCFVACNDRDDLLPDSLTDDEELRDNDDEDTDDSDTDDSTDNNDNTDSTENSEEGEGEITLYNVEGSSIVKVKDYEVTGTDLVFQNDVAKHQEIWELSKKIIPASYLGKISEFLIFSGEGSQTAGFVTPTNNDLSKWQYAIAIDFAYEGGALNADGELVHTIVHEFGHVITLNIEQVDSTIAESDCTNYFPGEGCSKSDSYINKLQSQYWADIWDEYNGLDSEESKAAFYTKYQDRYVSDYAATNPPEDIAEVFATFVIRAGGANGTAITEQKIALMYAETELTELRDFIRANDVVAKGNRLLPSSVPKRKRFCGTSRKLANFKH